ncbi:hypothetical protein ZIOFF_060226 [Zingiber officinale]|uniref:Uncharacterized protein n=1 Tax=Zingiber officinale TaxID=94328 RepID=A0A8J5FCE1_ZINOF|nr:hypothetical protein ZIOFF_060226 [Zingiber officinale]
MESNLLPDSAAISRPPPPDSRGRSVHPLLCRHFHGHTVADESPTSTSDLRPLPPFSYTARRTSVSSQLAMREACKYVEEKLSVKV